MYIKVEIEREVTITQSQIMGNTCVKKLPNITLTCINSGEMSSCCLNTKDSLDCDE